MSPPEPLKPCPFCGGKAMGGGPYIHAKPPTYYADCDECPASLGGCETMDELAIAWNRRAEAPALERIVCDLCGHDMMPGRVCVSCVLRIHSASALSEDQLEEFEAIARYLDIHGANIWSANLRALIEGLARTDPNRKEGGA